MIEDTTTTNFQGLKEATGLGPIGESYTQGLWVHSCLAVALDEQANQAQVLGLLGQQVWARPPQAIGPEDRRDAQKRQGRESERWMGAIEQSPGPLSPNRWVYVADREAISSRSYSPAGPWIAPL